MKTHIFEARAKSIAREICHVMAPTCRSCPLRAITVVTEPDLAKDEMRVRTRLHCGATRHASCPDELRPETVDDTTNISAKDMGMFRHLKTQEYEHRMVIPAIELHESGLTGAKDEGKALQEFFSKYIDHEILEVDPDLTNGWQNLLDHLKGLKHSWHGPIHETWQEAKYEYINKHVIEVKRSSLARTGMTEPTSYMLENLPPALHRPFVTNLEVKDMRPPRVVHPPNSRKSDPKEYAPPPPPKYHNWGAWGS